MYIASAAISGACPNWLPVSSTDGWLGGCLSAQLPCSYKTVLCCCRCCAGSLGCEALCKALKVAGSSGLKELNLSHLPLDDRAAAAVAGLLASSRVLERLLMTHSNITDAGAQLICNALQVGATLRQLQLFCLCIVAAHSSLACLELLNSCSGYNQWWQQLCCDGLRCRSCLVGRQVNTV